MPTVLRVGRYRFYFFSNENNEPPHIHIKAGDDEAKFWLNPIELASSRGFNQPELSQIERIVRQHQTELIGVWNEYFS